MSLSFEFITANLRTGALASLVRPSRATWSKALNTPGSATLAFHLDEVEPGTFEPNATALHILYEDRQISAWSGFVESVRINGSTRTVEVGLTSLDGYLHRRLLRSDETFSDARQVDITETLLGIANVEGIGFVPEIVEPAAVTRDREWFAHQRHTIGGLFDDLTSLISGLDYRVVVEPMQGFKRRFLLSDNLARQLPLTLYAGRDRFEWALEIDGGQQANRVDATGAGSSDAIVEATAEQDPGGFPRLDAVSSHRSITDAPTLQEHADSDLAQFAEAIQQPSVSLTVEDPGIALSPGSVEPGDLIDLKIMDGAAGFNNRVRILGWTTQWSRGTAPTLDFDLAQVVGESGLPAPRVPRLGDWIESQRARLARLEHPTDLTP